MRRPNSIYSKVRTKVIPFINNKDNNNLCRFCVSTGRLFLIISILQKGKLRPQKPPYAVPYHLPPSGLRLLPGWAALLVFTPSLSLQSRTSRECWAWVGNGEWLWMWKALQLQTGPHVKQIRHKNSPSAGMSTGGPRSALPLLTGGYARARLTPHTVSGALSWPAPRCPGSPCSSSWP